jgi:hypothetical protein
VDPKGNGTVLGGTDGKGGTLVTHLPHARSFQNHTALFGYQTLAHSNPEAGIFYSCSPHVRTKAGSCPGGGGRRDPRPR